LGWDDSNIKIVEVAKMIENVGASALTVHCRTRSQAHKGEVDYSWIPKIKSAVQIPIIVNGGIISPEIAKHVFDSTGCDGIMIGQAAIHNPWIFIEIKNHLSGKDESNQISLGEKIKMMLEHLRLSIELKGEKRGVLEIRKYYAGYIHGLPGAAKIRSELMKMTNIEQVTEFANSSILNISSN
jgi:tRNA-dihydrouridine synthase B